LTALSEATGLLHGQECLAAACAAPDLNSVEQADGIEDHGLMLGERIGRVLIGKSARNDVALR
jgi:hypothetical protein